MAVVNSKSIRVISAGAVEFVLTGIARSFTTETGIPVELEFSTIAGVRKRLAAGDPADLVIGTSKAIAELEAAGVLQHGTRLEIGSTETGICVREGAPLPDISTVENLKSVLLAARSFAYTDPAAGGTSGIYLRELMQKLGIKDAVEAKAVLCINGEDVVTKVASGRAELGSTFISEFFLADGVTSAGPLPREVANVTSYAGALSKGGDRADASARLLALLAAPQHRAAWRAGGFKPAA